jgi:Flp pilus assembly protein TadD
MAGRFLIESCVFGVVINLALHCPVLAESDPDKDPHFRELVAESEQLTMAKKSSAAIAQCDKVIAAFKAYYGKERRKIYCGNTSAEVLGNLLQAAVEKENAIALSPTWANAYFVKGYALQDLHRLAEAKTAILLALGLSPTNSHYLNELGAIYQLEKTWPKAKETFLAAEDNAPLSLDETRADDLARARRGLGYVYVELGQLAEAEKKYRQCLATNPNDSRARDELQYVEQLRAKQRK